MALVFSGYRRNNSIGIIDQGFCSRILSSHVFSQDEDIGRVFFAFLQQTPAEETSGRDKSAAVEMINYNMNLLLHISVGSKDVRNSAIKLINRVAAPVSLLAGRDADRRLMVCNSELKTQIIERVTAEIAEEGLIAEKLSAEAAKAAGVALKASEAERAAEIERAAKAATAEVAEAVKADVVYELSAEAAEKEANRIAAEKRTGKGKGRKAGKTDGRTGIAEKTSYGTDAEYADSARPDTTEAAAGRAKEAEMQAKAESVLKADADAARNAEPGVYTKAGLELKREPSPVTPGSILRKYAFSGMLTTNAISGFNPAIYQYRNITARAENGPEGPSSVSRIYRYVQETIIGNTFGQVPKGTYRDVRSASPWNTTVVLPDKDVLKNVAKAVQGLTADVEKSNGSKRVFSGKAADAGIDGLLRDTAVVSTPARNISTPVRNTAEEVFGNSEAENDKETVDGNAPAGTAAGAGTVNAAESSGYGPTRIIPGSVSGQTDGHKAGQKERSPQITIEGNIEENTEETAGELDEALRGETVRGTVLYNNTNMVNWVHLFQSALPDTGVRTDNRKQVVVQPASTAALSEQIWKSAVRCLEVFIPSILKLDRMTAYSTEGAREFEQLLQTGGGYRGSARINLSKTTGTIKSGIIQLLESAGSIFNIQPGRENRYFVTGDTDAPKSSVVHLLRSSTAAKAEYGNEGNVFDPLVNRREKKTEIFPFLLALKTLKLYRTSLKEKDLKHSYYSVDTEESSGINTSVPLLFENGERSVIQLNDINQLKSRPVTGKLVYIEKESPQEEVHPKGQEAHTNHVEIERLIKAAANQPGIALTQRTAGRPYDTAAGRTSGRLKETTADRTAGKLRETAADKVLGILKDTAGEASAVIKDMATGSAGRENQEIPELKLILSRSGESDEPSNEIASKIWAAHSQFMLKVIGPSDGQGNNRNRPYRVSLKLMGSNREPAPNKGDTYKDAFGTGSLRLINMLQNAGMMDVTPVQAQNRTGGPVSLLKPGPSYQDMMTDDIRRAPIVYRNQPQNTPEAVNHPVDRTEPVETKTRIINDTVQENVEIHNADQKNAAVDIEGLVNKVYRKLEDRLRTERQRRGLFR